jgi:hypothetical protein
MSHGSEVAQRLLERLPAVTLVTSVPLFFSMLLHEPPDFLHGLLFVAVWTWGVIAAIALPALILVESAACWWLRDRLSNRSLSRHCTALLVALFAEAVFVMAVRNL